jgi:predicted HicB family RNase H-like nuclease
MKRQSPDRKIISTNTRYPKELYEAMVRLAQKHKRSLNAEVMWALQVYVEQQEGKASRD